MATAKKYFFLQYEKNGKTFYKNQDGKRVSKDKVKKAKRAVYLLNQKTGDILKRERVYTKESKTKKAPKKPSILRAFNGELSSEYRRAKEKELSMYVKIGGKVYEMKSEKSKSNLSILIFQINSIFYKKLKKKIDSPFFDLPIIENKKDRSMLFDLDALNLDEADLDEEIADIFEEFREEVREAFKKLYTTKRKNEKKKK